MAENTGIGWPVYDVAPPFLGLSWDGRESASWGQDAWRLGTRIPRQDGQPADGVYAGWTWDGTTLKAHVDPHGMYSLFVYQKGAEIALSPSVLELIAQGAEPELDARALSVFYRLGHFLHQDTPFRHIKVLGPGAALTWHQGKARIETDGITIPPVQSISRNSAVDGLVELTRESLRAVSDAIPEPLTLPLSGGRDSRHILLALDHIGRRPDLCVTFQHAAMARDSDTAAARAICERMGVPHRVLGKPRSRPRDLMRVQVLTSLCSDEHMQIMPLHDFLGTGNGAALDGIAGDILTNPDDDADGYFRKAERGDYTGIARDLMAGHARVVSRAGDPDGPGQAFSPADRDTAGAYVAEALQACSGAADPYQAYWFWHRTRREIGFVSSALFGTGPACGAPFLDRDLVRFCLSLPYSVTRDQQLHNAALARGYPECADIGFAESFAPRVRHKPDPVRKLRMAMDGIASLLALHPAHPLSEIGRYLRGHETLHRRPGEVYQLHHLMLSGLDAELARTILDLAARYRRAASTDLVSDRFDPTRV